MRKIKWNPCYQNIVLYKWLPKTCSCFNLGRTTLPIRLQTNHTQTQSYIIKLSTVSASKQMYACYICKIIP